jgi:thioester reductase-like protein
MDDVVLLTGLPSFYARRLCEGLLEAPRTFVHAVVPDRLAAEAEQFRGSLPADQRSRLGLLAGDAASMDMGLSGAEYRALSGEVDRIHHAANVSYLGVDERTADQANVGSAREAVELARACPGLRALVHHSTALVSGDRTGLVLETELQCGQRFRNAAEGSMARAEKLVRGAADKIPVVVVRPSIVVGDSRTGEIDQFDGIYLPILLLVTSPPDFALPLPGRGDAALHLVPVDYVARAALALGRDPRAVGRTFHLVDPTPLNVQRVFELVALASGRRAPRGFIPANLTRALLRTPGIERLAKSPRALLDTLGTPVTYDASGTAELLAGTDILCPPFESYVERLVDYVKLRLRERREKTEQEVHDPLG